MELSSHRQAPLYTTFVSFRIGALPVDPSPRQPPTVRDMEGRLGSCRPDPRRSMHYLPARNVPVRCQTPVKPLNGPPTIALLQLSTYAWVLAL